MAEFQEVMKQKQRMCHENRLTGCKDCGIARINNGQLLYCEDFIVKHPAETESIVMKWAAEHPEPVYPSWDDAWKQLFPDSYAVKMQTDKAPCLKYFLSDYECGKWKYPLSCIDCRKQPTPANLAKRLGIEPINQ